MHGLLCIYLLLLLFVYLFICSSTAPLPNWPSSLTFDNKSLSVFSRCERSHSFSNLNGDVMITPLVSEPMPVPASLPKSTASSTAASILKTSMTVPSFTTITSAGPSTSTAGHWVANIAPSGGDQHSAFNHNRSKFQITSVSQASLLPSDVEESGDELNDSGSSGVFFSSDSTKTYDHPAVLTTTTPAPVEGPKISVSRFQLIKIETKEPFKRGRWMCRDYNDPPAATHVASCLMPATPASTTPVSTRSSSPATIIDEPAVKRSNKSAATAASQPMDVLNARIAQAVAPKSTSISHPSTTRPNLTINSSRGGDSRGLLPSSLLSSLLPGAVAPAASPQHLGSSQMFTPSTAALLLGDGAADRSISMVSMESIM